MEFKVCQLRKLKHRITFKRVIVQVEARNKIEVSCFDYSDVDEINKVSVKSKLILSKLGQKFSIG